MQAYLNFHLTLIQTIPKVVGIVSAEHRKDSPSITVFAKPIKIIRYGMICITILTPKKLIKR